MGSRPAFERVAMEVGLRAYVRRSGFSAIGSYSGGGGRRSTSPTLRGELANVLERRDARAVPTVPPPRMRTE